MSPYPADPEWAKGPMRVVLTTYPDRERALTAVAGALTRRLAACGNVVPVESRYWWKGELVTQTEAMVLFKTVPKRVGALFRFLAEAHPYSVPELIELDVPRAGPGYLAYLTNTIDRASIGPESRPTPRRRAGRRDRAARAPPRTRGRLPHRSRRTGTPR
ncbi:MAG TPA: divalent-cation tolerance protein CutA [Thermoplasmata archaeon]|nr:divalent-cation tolerance protein CutA [Thermoplasmata archaeon]